MEFKPDIAREIMMAVVECPTDIFDESITILGREFGDFEVSYHVRILGDQGYLEGQRHFGCWTWIRIIPPVPDHRCRSRLCRNIPRPQHVAADQRRRHEARSRTYTRLIAGVRECVAKKPFEHLTVVD